jgi:circadian clock protein KaiB
MKPNVTFRFRLYIAGMSQNSVLAQNNIRDYCRMHIPDRHDIEIVDVLEDHQRALSDGVLVTPTLVRLAPMPECRIVGNLNNSEWLISALGFDRAIR